MIKINQEFLQDVGLGSLDPATARQFLTHVYATLEMRVGMELAKRMTNDQLDEFEVFFEAGDDAGAFAWLERNFPNYRKIVSKQFHILRAEVRQSASGVLADVALHETKEIA